MAGQVLYKKGRHASRLPATGELSRLEAIEVYCRATEIVRKKIRKEDFNHLCGAILFARAEVARDRQINSTKKDTLRQLRAMLREPERSKLIQALRDCDARTQNAIETAQTAMICELIDEHGVFVDTEGQETQYPCPPYLAFLGFPDIEPRMPMGIYGVLQAINRAIASEKSAHDRRGRKSMPYQSTLAQACVRFWRTYHPGERVCAWRTHSGNSSTLVQFVGMVFEVAGMPLDSSRIETLVRRSI